MKFFAVLPVILLATNGIFAAPFDTPSYGVAARSDNAALARRNDEFSQRIEDIINSVAAEGDLSRRDEVHGLLAREILTELDARFKLPSFVNLKNFGILGTIGGLIGPVISAFRGNDQPKQRRDVNDLFVRDFMNELEARKIPFGKIFEGLSSAFGIGSGIAAITGLFRGNDQQKRSVDDLSTLAAIMSMAGQN
jgi:hypothetical protein